MLWTLAAIAQRRKDMDKVREEGRKEGMERTIQRLIERGVDLPPEILKDLKDGEQR